MVVSLENANPTVFNRTVERVITSEEENDSIHDAIDSREIFDHIRNINDPEHPLTLEQLNVVEESRVLMMAKSTVQEDYSTAIKKVDDSKSRVTIHFTPTIPHCSMATLIGLCIRVKLLRVLPPRFKVDVVISPGTHVSETAINKQLADKERVAAAMENTSLLSVLNQCLVSSRH